jgi:NAD(P)-dependent dehydrogenase (short-subunit alcohol dehydrogenase family)
MDTLLHDRVALVTGGSRGIGRATAEALAQRGARVMIVARKQEALIRAADEIGKGTEWFAANVADAEAAEAAVAATISRLGRLDILVNNASTNPYFGPLMGIDEERARRTVQVNQWGVVLWAQLAWKAWLKEHGGRIVNVSSIGAMDPEPNIAWYNATKAATVQLTRQMAIELGPSVTVNCVAPGVIKTDLSRAIWEGRESVIESRVPAGRLGKPEDVGAMIAFLASDAASYVTGQTIVVDGGITLGGSVADD